MCGDLLIRSNHAHTVGSKRSPAAPLEGSNASQDQCTPTCNETCEAKHASQLGCEQVPDASRQPAEQSQAIRHAKEYNRTRRRIAEEGKVNGPSQEKHAEPRANQDKFVSAKNPLYLDQPEGQQVKPPTHARVADEGTATNRLYVQV